MVDISSEAKRQLEAAIAAAGGSDDPNVYLRAFKDLGKLLLDAEADKLEVVALGPDSFERTLIDDAAPRIVEMVFPDMGSVPDVGSDHRKALSIRHDLSTGTLSEREPGGNWSRPSREVQAAYARLGYWDEFAPACARLALYDSPKRYEEFREAMRQHLERQALKRVRRFSTVPTPKATPERAPAGSSSVVKPNKGNLDMLRATDGELKRAVNLDVASRFGGVSRRAIADAARKGSLKTEGKRQQRRVLVDSLLKYFPPEK